MTPLVKTKATAPCGAVAEQSQAADPGFAAKPGGGNLVMRDEHTPNRATCKHRANRQRGAVASPKSATQRSGSGGRRRFSVDSCPARRASPGHPRRRAEVLERAHLAGGL